MVLQLLSPLAAAASGVLYGLAFPPSNLQWLAWVALVPLLVAVRGGGLRAALFSAWVFTTVSSYVTGDWFPRAVSEYFGQGPLIGFAAFFAISTLMGGPGVLGFTAAYRWLTRRTRPAGPLLAAAAWVTGELVRARLLTGNPWILLGYSQFGVAPLVQIADVTGVYGVSFVLAAVNAALAELCVGIGSQHRVTRRAAGGLVVAAACVALVVGYGRWCLDRPVPDVGAVPIGIVQGNVDLGAQWREELRGRNLDLYGDLTVRLLRAAPVRLVVWPETALTFFLDGREGLPYRASIASLLRPGQVQLVTGGPRVDEQEGPPRYFNAAFVVAPDGVLLAHYDKQHLLPFAEYTPLPSLDLLRRDFGRVREFTAGGPGASLPTVAGRAGVLICNEAMFPEIAAARVRDGAQYLINLSNDTWLNDRTYSEITFSMVAFRAVEQRRFLVRASSSGPSAIVDPRGRVLVRSEPLSQAFLSGAVAPRDQRTPYARLGDSFVFACAAVVVGVLLRGAWAAARGTPAAGVSRPDSGA